MTSLINTKSLICFSVLLLFPKCDVTTAASFHAVDCNGTTSQADFQYASTNGKAVGPIRVNNGTFDVFQQFNQRPTWAYYRGMFNLTNGNSTIDTIPDTDKVVFEINFTVGNRTICKLFHINNF